MKTRNRYKVGDLVMVEWEDSAQPTPGWAFLNDIQSHAPIHCTSVGWLIHDGKVKSLAQNMGDTHNKNAQASGIMRIAARSVLKVTKLRNSSVSS